MNGERIKVIVRGGPGHDADYQEFLMTSTSDKDDLPKASSPPKIRASAGSKAYTKDLQHFFMLSPQDEWEEV